MINKDTKEILGASLYGKESEELINLIKLAIDQHIPYTVLRDNIYTHPTMTESFNDFRTTLIFDLSYAGEFTSCVPFYTLIFDH